MTNKQIEEAIEDVMTAIREHDAFNPDVASKDDSREFLRGIIDLCRFELDALGDE